MASAVRIDCSVTVAKRKVENTAEISETLTGGPSIFVLAKFGAEFVVTEMPNLHLIHQEAVRKEYRSLWLMPSKNWRPCEW